MSDVVRASGKQREDLLVLRDAFAKALASGPAVSSEDAAMMLANLLGDALAQAFGAVACAQRDDGRPSPLDLAMQVTHAAIHLNLDAHEGSRDAEGTDRPAGAHLH